MDMNSTLSELAWAWDSTLIAVAKLHAPCSLDLRWHPSDPDPRMRAVADIAEALLEGVCAKEMVQKLTWSPDYGLAAVTRISGRRDAVGRLIRPGDSEHKLYVLAPGQELVSMTLHHFGERGKLFWSPAGDRILLETWNTLELVTSRCSNTCPAGVLSAQMAGTSDWWEAFEALSSAMPLMVHSCAIWMTAPAGTLLPGATSLVISCWCLQ